MPLTKEQERRKKVAGEMKKMPLKTLDDYAAFNEKARSMGVPVRPAPTEMHDHVKVKFLRRDGMSHPVKLKFRNEFIDYEKIVEPGKVYEMPKLVVRQYQDLGIPKYKQYINNATGESETVFSHKDPRFAFQIVFDD